MKWTIDEHFFTKPLIPRLRLKSVTDVFHSIRKSSTFHWSLRSSYGSVIHIDSYPSHLFPIICSSEIVLFMLAFRHHFLSGGDYQSGEKLNPVCRICRVRNCWCWYLNTADFTRIMATSKHVQHFSQHQQQLQLW